VDVNGRYFVEYVLASGARRVLDYGCGEGELVVVSNQVLEHVSDLNDRLQSRVVRRLGFMALEMRR
jgi:hypothetical protein